MKNFIKVSPVKAELFHGVGKIDGRTEVTKLIVSLEFRDSA
jgi:hypothetical protein